MRATDDMRATIRNVNVIVVTALIGLPVLATSQAAPSHAAFWVTAGLGIGTTGSTGVQLAGWLGKGRMASGLLTSQEGASKHRRYATGVVLGFRPTLEHKTVVIGGGWGFIGGCDGCGGGIMSMSAGTRAPDRFGPIFVAQWIADVRRIGIGASVVGVPGTSSQLTWALTFRFGGR